MILFLQTDLVLEKLHHLLTLFAFFQLWKAPPFPLFGVQAGVMPVFYTVVLHSCLKVNMVMIYWCHKTPFCNFEFCGLWLILKLWLKLLSVWGIICEKICDCSPWVQSKRSNQIAFCDRLTFSQNGDARPPGPPPWLKVSAQSVLKLQFDPSIEEVHTHRV